MVKWRGEKDTVNWRGRGSRGIDNSNRRRVQALQEWRTLGTGEKIVALDVSLQNKWKRWGRVYAGQLDYGGTTEAIAEAER